MATSISKQIEMGMSVQEMVKNPIDEIPTKFVVDLEPTNPNNSPSSLLPIVDMQTFLDEETRSSQLEALDSTCKELGVFQLVNHGVDASVLERVKNEIKGFYRLPLDERSKYKIRPGDVEGYGQTSLHMAHQKIDWADRFYITINPISRRKPHLFPKLPTPLRDALEAYLSELQKVATNMLGLLSEALKIDKREIQEKFGDGMQSIRMNYYPPCPMPNKVVGLTPHSDASGMTLLLEINGVQGLQIKKDGIWMPVNFLPDAFVVFLGDIFEILSNGLYKSVEHRVVVNTEKERISMGMFFNPKFEAQVGPLPSLLVKQPPLFRTIGMEQYVKDFFSRRLASKTFLNQMKI